MKREEIVKELNEFADNLIIQKRFQKNLKQLFVDKSMRFIDNENTVEGKEKLLKIIKKISWIHMSDVNLFFQEAVCKIIRKIDNDIYLIYQKNNLGGSNNQIISSLAMNCEVNVNNYIECEKKKDEIILMSDYIQNSTILILDDYSGSGGTVSDIIDEIEKKYEDNDVYMVIYIWQEKAYNSVKDKISGLIDRKNKYHIYGDDENEGPLLIEKCYKDKFENENEIIKLIEDVCNGCSSEAYKFGYDETGAMISINGVSPNNNISMIWNKDIKYKGMAWTRLLDRDLCWEVLDNKKDKIAKENLKIKTVYKTNKYINEKITLEEFQLLVYLYNEYAIDIEYLRKIMGYDTKEEIEEKLKKFQDLNMIKISNSIEIEFCDQEILKELRKIDHILNNIVYEASKIQNKKIS